MPAKMPTVPPRTMWRIMFVMFALTVAILLTVVHVGVRHPLAPSLAPWALGVGLVLALPALLTPTHVHIARRSGAGGASVDNARLITACSLSELPAMAGVAYYLLGGAPRGTALLVLVSVILLARLYPAR